MNFVKEISRAGEKRWAAWSLRGENDSGGDCDFLIAPWTKKPSSFFLAPDTGLLVPVLRILP